MSDQQEDTGKGYVARLLGSIASAAKSATVEGSIGLAGGFATAAMAIGAIVFVPLLVGTGLAVIWVAYSAILRLGVNHFAPSLIDPVILERAATEVDMATYAAFLGVAPASAATTAGLPALAALGLLLFAKRLNNGIKGLLVVVMVAWSMVLLMLALYESALTFKLTTIPPSLVGMGSFVYAALSALAVLPVAFGFSAARNMRDDKYTSVFHAAAHIVGVMLESVVLIAALAGEAFFGMAVGLDPVFVVPASAIAAFGFIWGRGRLADAKKRKDAFDVVVWAFLLVGFGGYAGIITALSVQHLSAPLVEVNGVLVRGAERLTLFGDDIKSVAENSYQLVLGAYIFASLLAEFLTERVDGTTAQIVNWFKKVFAHSPRTVFNSDQKNQAGPRDKDGGPAPNP